MAEPRSRGAGISLQRETESGGWAFSRSVGLCTFVCSVRALNVCAKPHALVCNQLVDECAFLNGNLSSKPSVCILQRLMTESEMTRPGYCLKIL